MKIFMRKCICMLLTAAFLAGLVACSNSKKPTAAQNEKMDELAQEFMTELRDSILPVKDREVLLAEIGVMVSREEKVSDMSLFEGFMQGLDEGDNGTLTIAFMTKSYVVSRLQYVDGVGYYFRYEYDVNAPIAVSSKVFDNYKVTTDEALGKVMLMLEYGNKEIVTMTFRPDAAEGD